MLSYDFPFQENDQKHFDHELGFLSTLSGQTLTPSEDFAFPDASINNIGENCEKPTERLQGASKKISKERGRKPRQTWTDHEDHLLLELVQKYGLNWGLLSLKMGGARSGKQIRDRYLNKLNPAISKKKWEAAEDQLILHLYKVYGRKWCIIAKQLPGRTETMVKNRFYTKLKDQVNEDALYGQNLEKGEGSQLNTLNSSDSIEQTCSHPSDSFSGNMDCYNGNFVGLWEENNYFPSTPMQSTCQYQNLNSFERRAMFNAQQGAFENFFIESAQPIQQMMFDECNVQNDQTRGNQSHADILNETSFLDLNAPTYEQGRSRNVHSDAFMNHQEDYSCWTGPRPLQTRENNHNFTIPNLTGRSMHPPSLQNEYQGAYDTSKQLRIDFLMTRLVDLKNAYSNVVEELRFLMDSD